MIELLVLFLFVMPGEDPGEYASCDDPRFQSNGRCLSSKVEDFPRTAAEKLFPVTPQWVVFDGEIRWYRLASENTKEMLERWDFFQDRGVKETLVVDISMCWRCLPFPLFLNISFDYVIGGRQAPPPSETEPLAARKADVWPDTMDRKTFHAEMMPQPYLDTIISAYRPPVGPFQPPVYEICLNAREDVVFISPNSTAALYDRGYLRECVYPAPPQDSLRMLPETYCGHCPV